MSTYRVEIDGGIETVTARTEKEAIRKAARKQGNSMSVGKVFGPKVKVTKIKEEAQMKTFDELMVELSEGKAANPAQQAAIAIAKKEKSVKEKMDPTDHVKEKDGKFCVYNADGTIAKEFDNKKDADAYAIANHDKMMATKKDVDEKTDPAAMAKAMAAFKKRGGKIKKLAPGKAAGYHGKDDPGSDVHGMIGKSDTKGFGTRKKIGSMKK